MLYEMMFIPKIHTHPCNKAESFISLPQELLRLLLQRNQRLFFAVSLPQELLRLLLSAVFVLTFRASPFTQAVSAFIFRCHLCIPFGTTFEQKTYAAIPQERLFVVLANLHCVPQNDFLLLQQNLYCVPQNDFLLLRQNL